MALTFGTFGTFVPQGWRLDPLHIFAEQVAPLLS
jgi:hypothetical protein